MHFGHTRAGFAPVAGEIHVHDRIWSRIEKDLPPRNWDRGLGEQQSRWYRGVGIMGTGTLIRSGATSIVTAAAVCLLAFASPSAASTKVPVRKTAVPTLTLDVDGTGDHLRANTLTSFAPGLIDSGKFSFTAPGTSPANARLATSERAFRFTPSGKIDSRRAFSIGVTSRVTAPVLDTSRAAAVPLEVAAATPTVPAAYSVDLAVGWHNFAVSGGYARSDANDILPIALALSTPGRREAVDAGVSYRGASWKTSVQVAAEEGPALLLNPLASSAPAQIDRRYSLEVGGAYSLTPQLSVTGGVKYKATVSPNDPLRRDQAVYLGTAFTF